MKSKKFEKKLALNKKTIADLSNGQLKQVKGGCMSAGETSCQTYTCFTDGCCLSDWCYTQSIGPHCLYCNDPEPTPPPYE
jgi:hypothetical protein